MYLIYLILLLTIYFKFFYTEERFFRRIARAVTQAPKIVARTVTQAPKIVARTVTQAPKIVARTVIQAPKGLHSNLIRCNDLKREWNNKCLDLHKISAHSSNLLRCNVIEDEISRLRICLK
jgi:hypothetical protein